MIQIISNLIYKPIGVLVTKMKMLRAGDCQCWHPVMYLVYVYTNDLSSGKIRQSVMSSVILADNININALFIMRS